MKSIKKPPQPWSFWLTIIFLSSLPFGQLGSLPLGNGIFIYLHDIALLLLVGWFALYVLKKQALVFAKPLVGLVCFCLIAIISYVVNVSTVTGFEVLRGGLYVMRFLLYASVPLILIQMKLNWHLFIKGLIVVGTAFTTLGFLQLFWFPSLKPLVGAGWDEHLNRLFSTLFDPNFTGMVLVLTLLSIVPFLLTKEGQLSLNRWWGLFIFVMAGVVATFSRSAYLALAVGMLIVVLRLRLYRLLIIVIVLGLSIFLIVPRDGRDTNRLTRITSSLSRVTNWQQSLVYFSERPILGYGYNLLRARTEQMVPENETGIVSRDKSSLDSSVLFILATTGMLGGAVYFWWLVQLLLFYRSHYQKPLGTVAISSTVAVLAFSWFNNGLFYPWILLWLLILLAAVISDR